MSSLVRRLLSTAPLIHQSCAPGGILKRAKYCFRGLLFARYTREWFEFLEAPGLTTIVRNYPCLYHKLQRPYLNRALNTFQRLDALKQHYKFVITYFSPATIGEIYSPAGKLLAELPLETPGVLELRLSGGKMQKEGDLTISLEGRDPKKRISTLSFSVWKCQEDSKDAFIGGLQGDKAVNEQMIVSITRELHGLRPKALLFYTLQQLGSCWGINRIQAVSDEMHVYRHFQSRRNVTASYNKFWIECGSASPPGGIFDLPAAFTPRDISTIRVNKRQLYRRRYAMLERIRAQVQASLSQGAHAALPPPFFPLKAAA